jgi:hypothetical protein
MRRKALSTIQRRIATRSAVGLVADDSDRSWQRSSSKGAGCGIDQPSRRKTVDSTIG